MGIFSLKVLKHTFLDFRVGAERSERFLGFFEKKRGMAV